MIAAIRVRRAQLIAGWIISSLVAESIAVAFAFATVAVSFGGALSAAAVEGALLGLSQRWLLRTFVRPGFERAWLPATLAGALLGRALEYAADMSPSLHVVAQWSQAQQFGAGIAVGFVVGAVMAAPQAFALRGRVHGPWRWIVVRGAAWALALPIIGVASALLVDSVTGSTLGMLGIVAVTAAGVGAIEGLSIATLARLEE
jgi:hypothetical protein